MEIIRAFFMIFMAEMGDKTQILAMAFATQFAVLPIVIGVTIGSFFNHGLAIILGQLLSQWLDLNLLQIVAGVAFIGFAFWSLQVDEEEDEDVSMNKYGPIMTVALAFFIGELGDKTQLTALTLGSVSKVPFLTLIGTTLGMVATSYIGIFVGKRLGKAVPELMMKTGAACIFIFFGFEKLISNNHYLTLVTLLPILGVILIVFIIALMRFRKTFNAIEETKYQRYAGSLRAYKTALEGDFESLCLGIDVCGTCDGTKCAVGYLKNLIRNAEDMDDFDEEMVLRFLEKNHSIKDAESILESIIEFYKKHTAAYDEEILHRVRHVVESIVFKTYIEGSSLEEYLIELEKVREKG